MTRKHYFFPSLPLFLLILLILPVSCNREPTKNQKDASALDAQGNIPPRTRPFSYPNIDRPIDETALMRGMRLPTSDIFPLRPGATYHYKLSGTGAVPFLLGGLALFPDGNLYVTVISDTLIHSFISRREGSLFYNSYLTWTGEHFGLAGISGAGTDRRGSAMGVEISMRPPLKLLPLDAGKNHIWEGVSEVYLSQQLSVPIEYKGKIERIPAPLKLQGGVFAQCFKTSITAKVEWPEGTFQLTRETILARGVGIVQERIVQKVGGRTLESKAEILSFKV